MPGWHLAGSPFPSPFLAVPWSQANSCFSLFCFKQTHERVDFVRCLPAEFHLLLSPLQPVSCFLKNSYQGPFFSFLCHLNTITRSMLLYITNIHITEVYKQRRLKYPVTGGLAFLYLNHRNSGIRYNPICTVSIKISNRWHIARCSWRTK